MPRITGQQVVEQGFDSKDRNSNYFITLSTNYRPTDDADEFTVREKLRGAIDHIFGSEEGLAKIIHFNYPSHNLSDRYVQDVDYKFAIEKGAHRQGGRVHAHVVLKIKHQSNISLSGTVVKREFEDFFSDDPRIKGFYVNIKLIADAEIAFQKYLEKQQRLRAAALRTKASGPSRPAQ
jgi:hypothetical protein